MTRGLKVWLWLVLAVNAISGVMAIVSALLIPLMWVVVAAEALVVAGAVMLLFPRKKMGFFLICGGAAVSKLTNTPWPKGTVAEPHGTKWAATPAFRSGPPLQLASWINKGLDWGSIDEVQTLQSDVYYTTFFL